MIQLYDKKEADLKQAGDKLEAEYKEWNQRSDEQMHVHHRWALAAGFVPPRLPVFQTPSGDSLASIGPRARTRRVSLERAPQ